ncbi:MAG: hypothetical protein SPLM_10800 [Spiroplasma phoeniceum]|uniref:hypothetical protein n=1 Tax=Spiroplasma phoeniceum TaxID=47835 RepID=UPI003133FFB8
MAKEIENKNIIWKKTKDNGYDLRYQKIKKYKAEIRELRTAVIAHEKHLRGPDYATELALKTGQIKNVKKQVKVNDKKQAQKDAIRQLTNSI